MANLASVRGTPIYYISKHTLTSADEVPALSVAKIVKHLVPVSLHHLGVDEEAQVAQLSDLLGQQLHALD